MKEFLTIKLRKAEKMVEAEKMGTAPIFSIKNGRCPHFCSHFLLFSVVIFILFLVGCGSTKSSLTDIGNKVYVPNKTDNTITVVPATESETTDIITLDKSPQFMARVPESNTVFVLLAGTNQISKIDSSTDSLDETITFEIGAPTAQVNNRVIFSPNGQKAYFSTSYDQASVAVMNVADNSFLSGINFNSSSMELFFFSNDGTTLFCTDSSKGDIYTVNTSTDDLIETIQVPESFSPAVLYNPATGNFWMAESGNQATVKEFDMTTKTFINRVEGVTNNIVKLILSPDGTKLYALGGEELVRINLSDHSVEDRVVLDYRSPVDFQFLPGADFALIPSSSADLLVKLSMSDLTTSAIIDTGQSPGEIIIFE